MQVDAQFCDPELCMRHDDGVLTCIMSKHVDDLKFAGVPAVVSEILREIQLVFGEMKVNQHEFTNCGVRHIQCPRTMAVTLDQIHFAATLQTISHPQITNGQLTDIADETLHSLYRSLLGAVAYLAHTRVDILVFVCALQRHVARPTVEHARKLNRVLRWIQKNPKKLHYVPLSTSATHLRVVSDAAFKKETEDGYSLRGALFLRCEGSFTNNDHTTQTMKPCADTMFTSTSTSPSTTALSTSPGSVCQPPCASRLCRRHCWTSSAGSAEVPNHDLPLALLQAAAGTCRRPLYCKTAKTVTEHATARANPRWYGCLLQANHDALLQAYHDSADALLQANGAALHADAQTQHG